MIRGATLADREQSRAQAKAAKRRMYQQAKADAASTGRLRLWAYVGWLVAECKYAPPDVFDEVVEQVAGLCEDLNERARS